MINAQLLAARGALSERREDIFHALAVDPITAAVLSLDEIKAMSEEMFDALADQIADGFKRK